MRSIRWALVFVAALALVSGLAASAARATGPSPPPVPSADSSECWKGHYTKTGKKAIRAECCEQMEGSYLCTRVGDDDALVEFGPGDCRPSRNRRQLKCEKACGSGCSHKFDGSR
ncbi:MAG: hypothetical protein HY906_17955 [Deltaproteobacteria bacterium]|nr:hypothetical protein [Deltaproteobacteria bacterium]